MTNGTKSSSNQAKSNPSTNPVDLFSPSDSDTEGSDRGNSNGSTSASTEQTLLMTPTGNSTSAPTSSPQANKRPTSKSTGVFRPVPRTQSQVASGSSSRAANNKLRPTQSTPINVSTRLRRAPKICDPANKVMQAVITSMERGVEQGLIDSAETLPPPNFVVLGDQSAGKSTLISALTGFYLEFGRKCTSRGPTEVRSITTDQLYETIRVYMWIVEEADSTPVDPFPVELIAKSKRSEVSNNEIVKQIKKGQRGVISPIFNDGQYAGIDLNLPDNAPISEMPELSLTKNRVIIEIRGPHVASYSVVDLPGLQAQGEARATIDEIVSAELEADNTIALCLCGINSELKCARALEILNHCSHPALRSIIVVTKLDKAEDAECAVAMLAQAKDAIFVAAGAPAARASNENLAQLIDSEAETIKNLKADGYIPDDFPAHQLGMNNLFAAMNRAVQDILQSKLQGFVSDIEAERDEYASFLQELDQRSELPVISIVHRIIDDASASLRQTVSKHLSPKIYFASPSDSPGFVIRELGARLRDEIPLGIPYPAEAEAKVRDFVQRAGVDVLKMDRVAATKDTFHLNDIQDRLDSLNLDSQSIVDDDVRAVTADWPKHFADASETCWQSLAQAIESVTIGDDETVSFAKVIKKMVSDLLDDHRLACSNKLEELASRVTGNPEVLDDFEHGAILDIQRHICNTIVQVDVEEVRQETPEPQDIQLPNTPPASGRKRGGSVNLADAHVITKKRRVESNATAKHHRTEQAVWAILSINTHLSLTLGAAIKEVRSIIQHEMRCFAGSDLASRLRSAIGSEQADSADKLKYLLEPDDDTKQKRLHAEEKVEKLDAFLDEAKDLPLV